MKLCVFSLYSKKGASSQYRAYIYKKMLEKNFEVCWFNFWNDKYVSKYMHNKRRYCINILVQYLISTIKRIIQIVLLAPQCDVVFIQKAVVPKLRPTFLERVKKHNVRIVFDVDDAVYITKYDNSNAIARLSDCVICGNENLRRHYENYCTNCIVLPTVDNTNKYETYWHNTFQKKIIGWIGSQSTIDNFDVVIESLNIISSKHPEVKIAIISNTSLDYTDKIYNSYFIQWNSETYLQEISQFTVGIMPLKDNEYNKGKCGFKLVQYLNMKKPVIGTGIGVNESIIKGNGIIANSTEEWVDAIEKLLFDEDYYKECVTHIENDFFARYHFDIISNKLLSILINGEII